MNFTAKDVQSLREKTGAGMMDCKKALTEADGDMEKAVEQGKVCSIGLSNFESERLELPWWY